MEISFHKGSLYFSMLCRIRTRQIETSLRLYENFQFLRLLQKVAIWWTRFEISLHFKTSSFYFMFIIFSSVASKFYVVENFLMTLKSTRYFHIVRCPIREQFHYMFSFRSLGKHYRTARKLLNEFILHKSFSNCRVSLLLGMQFSVKLKISLRLRMRLIMLCRHKVNKMFCHITQTTVNCNKLSLSFWK